MSYNLTTAKIMTAFAHLFTGIYVERYVPATSNGQAEYNKFKVPLVYGRAARIAHDESLLNTPIYVNSGTMLSYEMTSMAPAPERRLNTLYTLSTTNNSVYQRVPYDFQFSVYITSSFMSDTIQIVEQIAPHFTPELILVMRDDPPFGDTDIPVILNSVSFSEIGSDGSMNSGIKFEWELQFTVKGYLYARDKIRGIDGKTPIQRVVVDVRTMQDTQKDES